MQQQDDTQAALKQSAREKAEAFRSFAAMLEANPEVAELTCLSALYAFIVHRAEDQAAIARAALMHGARVDKDITDAQHNLLLKWGPVGFYVLANRENVCERVVVGTEKVTKTVKDPAAVAALPDVEVEETVETVEWVCRPLLANKSEAGAR